MEGQSECGLVNEHGKKWLAKPLVKDTNSAVIRQESDKTNNNVIIDRSFFFFLATIDLCSGWLKLFSNVRTPSSSFKKTNLCSWSTAETWQSVALNLNELKVSVTSPDCVSTITTLG